MAHSRPEVGDAHIRLLGPPVQEGNNIKLAEKQQVICIMLQFADEVK